MYVHTYVCVMSKCKVISTAWADITIMYIPLLDYHLDCHLSSFSFYFYLLLHIPLVAEFYCPIFPIIH